MYELALISLILACFAAVFGFTGIAAAYAATAQIIFYLFLAVSLFSFIANLFPKKKPNCKRLLIDIK